MTAVPRKKIVLGNTTIFFVKSKHLFGYSKQRYNDRDIFMAEPEKAIVDCLLHKVPLDYVREALEGENINYAKLAEHAQRTKNISLIKRLGYLLEQKTGNYFGLKAGDNNYIPLNYHLKKKGTHDQKWKLILNDH